MLVGCKTVQPDYKVKLVRQTPPDPKFGFLLRTGKSLTYQTCHNKVSWFSWPDQSEQLLNAHCVRQHSEQGEIILSRWTAQVVFTTEASSKHEAHRDSLEDRSG